MTWPARTTTSRGWLMKAWGYRYEVCFILSPRTYTYTYMCPHMMVFDPQLHLRHFERALQARVLIGWGWVAGG